MKSDQKKQLETALWATANDLRGKMDADEFRDYILGFIFYKYLSEKIEKFVANSEPGVNFREISDDDSIVSAAQENADELGFFLRPSQLFANISQNAENNSNLNTDLTNIFREIENSASSFASRDDFDGLFRELNLESSKLGATTDERNKLVAKILKNLATIDFALENSEIDVLGDAYEYLIGQFASSAGKKAGEFYTPQEVSEVLARIVSLGRPKIAKVYDPTCGSGSLLLRIRRFAKVDQYFGQELNQTTFNLARMNMILHDVNYNDFDIKNGDTLYSDKFANLRADAIVANPPFSLKWEPSRIRIDDERFSDAGVLAPSSKADFSFIQHMIFHLAPEGKMAVVVPHGVLFRGAAEGKIREFLLTRNYLDAVIGLPANLFYGTSIPAAILVFAKNRKADDGVLFIDASKNFAKNKNQNQLREEDISRIIDSYSDRAEIEKFAHLASLDEIRENGFNLNIPRYVDTFEAEAEIDLEATVKEIREISANEKVLDETIAKYCDELGIERPF